MLFKESISCNEFYSSNLFPFLKKKTSLSPSLFTSLKKFKMATNVSNNVWHNNYNQIFKKFQYYSGTTMKYACLLTSEKQKTINFIVLDM